ncbi:MAG: hypothetical protein CM15mP75_7680 [Flammeovirgaceae bacterium]|nr:MAG: hypothetical protein CM15mP75_7680 [Flammeovirgaceae bacterium]
MISLSNTTAFTNIVSSTPSKFAPFRAPYPASGTGSVGIKDSFAQPTFMVSPLRVFTISSLILSTFSREL